MYTGFGRCLGSLVSKSVAWRANGRGLESHLRQPIFLCKMTVLGELCCVALSFCCVVVVALPFSASLEVIVHVVLGRKGGLVSELRTYQMPGFHTGLFGGRGEKFVGHCHSVMHEYETTSFQVLSMRLYKFPVFWGEGDSRAPHPLYETLNAVLFNNAS